MGSGHRRHRRVAVRRKPGLSEDLRALPPALHVHRRHRVHGRHRPHHRQRSKPRLHPSALVSTPPRSRLRRVLPAMDRKCPADTVRELREWRRHARVPRRASVPRPIARRGTRGERPRHGNHARPPRGHQGGPSRDRGDLARPARRRAGNSARRNHDALRLQPRAGHRGQPTVPPVRRDLPGDGANGARMRARIHEPRGRRPECSLARRRRGYLPRCHAEWKELIERHPWERLREILLEESDEGQRLRSSHPFKGLVTETERRAIHDAARA